MAEWQFLDEEATQDPLSLIKDQTMGYIARRMVEDLGLEIPDPQCVFKICGSEIVSLILPRAIKAGRDLVFKMIHSEKEGDAALFFQWVDFKQTAVEGLPVLLGELGDVKEHEGGLIFYPGVTQEDGVGRIIIKVGMKGEEGTFSVDGHGKGVC